MDVLHVIPNLTKSNSATFHVNHTSQSQETLKNTAQLFKSSKAGLLWKSLIFDAV